MHIAIIYSLPTRRACASAYIAADEDTKDSAEEVAAAIKSKGAQALLVPISEDSIGKIGEVRGDILFNLIEWDGLDGQLLIRAMDVIERTGIPYTGSSKAALAVCNDKPGMKQAMSDAGLPTSRWQVFTSGAEPVRTDFTYPLIVKPSLQHCSVGLTKNAVVNTIDDLLRKVKESIQDFRQPMIAEEFIVGREFQVTLLERKNGLVVLPPAEIVFTKSGTEAFLTYGSRWDEAHADYKESSVIKAQLTPEIMQSMYRVSHKAFVAMGFAGYARLDIRLRGKDIFILEANANPGLGDSDDYGMTVSYKAAGMTFADFVWEIVESCLRRNMAQR